MERSGTWTVSGFQVDIICDDQPLSVQTVNGVKYAVIRVGSSWFEQTEWETCPAGIRYSQDYRYTPFTVRVADVSSGETGPVNVHIYLDGKKAASKVLGKFPASGKNREIHFKGFETTEGVRQFCFSPPRVGPEKKDGIPNIEIGSIRMEFFRTIFKSRSDHCYSKTVDFKGTTKKDCVKAKQQIAGATTVASGKLIKPRKASSCNIYHSAKEENKFATGMIRYVTEYFYGVIKQQRLCGDAGEDGGEEEGIVKTERQGHQKRPIVAAGHEFEDL